MNHLIFLFGYVCCLAMVVPFIFSSTTLIYFAPFIILTFYRCPFNRCLWWAFLCGLFFDLFSSQTPLGTYALNYCLTVFLIYRSKDHFFQDALSTLPVITFFFTCCSNLIQGFLFYALGLPFFFTWDWVKSDLFLVPLFTALYAILAFTLPSLTFSILSRRHRLFRLSKRRKA